MAKTRQGSVEALLPLPLPVFHMLLGLSEGERHGYALKREILQRTGGKLNLGSGALYGSINKMLEQGLIEESEERPDSHLDDERRRYYRITALGRRAAQAEAVRLRQLVRLADESLGFPEPA
jgi:DNA-binding PadR family transcriptional regulator